MRMRAGSRGEESKPKLCWLAACDPSSYSCLLGPYPTVLEGCDSRAGPHLSRAYGPSFASRLGCSVLRRAWSDRASKQATMFKYLKQVLAPSAFEPELPPELLHTIRINAARKGSFMSSGSNASVPEFDPLIASAFELSEMLDAGAITSVEIVEAYLRQIEQHNRRGRNLRALISVAPRHELVRIARRLDDERSRGKRRGPLHGIPIVLKDNIMTEGALGMDTTVGRLDISGELHFCVPVLMFSCRLVRFRGVYTQTQRHHRRPPHPKRSHNTGQVEFDRVLWIEEPEHATGLVGGWRSVPVSIRSETHREEEVTLGTFGTRRLIDRLSGERGIRIQRSGNRDGYARVVDHTCESRCLVRT